MFAFAIEQDILTASPCTGLRPPAAEVARVWRACQGLGQYVDWHGETVARPVGGIIQLLILTGQRLREVSEMRWSEVDLDARTWSLPRERCKNGHAHVVPLADRALEIIRAFRGRRKRSIRRFPCRTGPCMICAASGMARLRVQPHMIEACLNHRSSVIRGVVSVYNRHSYADEKREALALWAAHVEHCVDAFTVIARPVEAVALNPECIKRKDVSDLYIQDCNGLVNRELEPA